MPIWLIHDSFHQIIQHSHHERLMDAQKEVKRMNHRIQREISENSNH